MRGWQLNRSAGDSPQNFNAAISKIESFLRANPAATQISRESWYEFAILSRNILDFAHLFYDRADLQRFVSVAGEVANLGVSGLNGSEIGREDEFPEWIKAYYLKGVEIDLLWEETVEDLVKISGPRYRAMAGYRKRA